MPEQDVRLKEALRPQLGKLDVLIESMLRAARIPGAAIAIVTDGEIVFTQGYGYRDLAAKLPVTSETRYPIASTTKAINATLLGMLVDDGLLTWDAPVQSYLPRFRLGDAFTSSHVTVRDLITLRTGLPRHDWAWMENPSSRADLVERIRYLAVSADFRERFQYNNLTVTASGHIAEVVTGRSWEELVQERLFQPLGMHATGFALPPTDNVTLSYHENSYRDLKPTERLATEVTGPSGGSIHSTVLDMAVWVSWNLNGGNVLGRPLVKSQTLCEIHSPQVLTGSDPSAPTANAAYALGWFVYVYNGHHCLSHGGYLHDVCSDVMFFPRKRLGIVSFTNFGFPNLAKLLNYHTFDLLMGLEPVQTLEEKLAEYEKNVVDTRQRNDLLRRVENTSPSHPLEDYAGVYAHLGYGKIRILRNGRDLMFQRNRLVLPLQHWHYDAWVAKDSGIFYIHIAHAFDAASRFVFETNADGEIDAVSIPLEPAVAPIRFEKE